MTASRILQHGADQSFERYRERFERALAAALRLPDSASARLADAMRYSALGGGKRLRPVLLYASGRALGANLDALDAPAIAVELIHVYSLVHDDLPAMDNDDLRRGRPSCHRAFDEATAILAGDALQALAFDVLAAPRADGIAADERLAMIRVLAAAIGTEGMAGGQAIDLEAVGRGLNLAQVEQMHRRKTGALIRAAVVLGALAAGVTRGEQFTALESYGAHIGLAFQIQDDILDVSGHERALGKATGADAARLKPTYPSVAGLDAATLRAQQMRDEAIHSLAPIGARAAELRELAQFIVDRAH